MTQKIAIWAPSHNFVGLYLRNWCMCRQSEKNLLSSNISSTCPHNMVNFGLLAAEIVSGVWGTPATFNGFRVLAALLYSSQVVSVSQTLRRWTEGATYVRQGDYHVGHWPTFLVFSFFLAYSHRSEIGCLPFFHTWCGGCGLGANLEWMSEMCSTQLAENTGCKNYAKKSPSAHRRTTLSGYKTIFANNARINNRKKLVKQQ